MSFSSRGDWAAWLAENHADAAGVWLRLERKTPGSAALTYPEALEAAIAHGWIDGTRKRLDERHYLQRFTPRRARSKWSKINRDKAVDLIERGQMTPAGLREVERAKADGRWDAAYAGQRTMEVPDDLARRARPEPGRARAVRRPGQPKPLRDPLPDRRREAARDAGPPDREVRRDAERGRDDLPANGQGLGELGRQAEAAERVGRQERGDLADPRAPQREHVDAVRQVAAGRLVPDVVAERRAGRSRPPGGGASGCRPRAATRAGTRRRRRARGTTWPSAASRSARPR